MPNRLAHTASPYLLHHAHNPVDWYPWGPEAFAAARDRDVPIFLSIGYSTCYWCHVMERQCFENKPIARLMNQCFVNIKVDREQRPDIDELYMTATQLFTSRGGWPNSLFLIPPGARSESDRGLDPFWAGTYLPPEPMQGSPSFPQILQAIAQAWADRRDVVLEQAEQLADAVGRVCRGEESASPLDLAAPQRAADTLMNLYDKTHGGFGGAPKFPQPMNPAFLLAAGAESQPAIQNAINHTLDAMARGGIHDHLAGGFHRYSTDAHWLVPHFEKMLYDNGQLLALYAMAHARADKTDPARRAACARVMLGIFHYLAREMTGPAGAFFSAQDAEVDAREGDNYLWTPDEIDAAIDDPPLATLAKKLYGLTEGPNFRDPHDAGTQPKNVLYLPKPIDQLATAQGISLGDLLQKQKSINEKLLAARDRRSQPATDDKILTAWNGMTIAGLALAAREIDQPDMLAAATRAADAILLHMLDDRGALYRCMHRGKVSIPGFLEDHAFLVHGLIELHRDLPEDTRYLDVAIRLTHAAMDKFAAPCAGYFDAPADQADLFAPVRSATDGAVPSAAGRMILNLLDLYGITADPAYLDRAAADLQSYAGAINQHPAATLQLCCAMIRIQSIAPEKLNTDAGKETPTDRITAVADPVRIHFDGDRARLTITVHIPSPYHLSAARVDDPSLIPTRLSLADESTATMTVDYPPPQRVTLVPGQPAAAVYQGDVEIHITLYRTTAALPDKLTLLLHYQPCTEDRCLQPQTLRLDIPVDSV